MIVHITPALFGPDGYVGGGERYVLELARHMASREPTRLVTFGKKTHRYRDGDLDIRVIGNSYSIRGNRMNPFSIRILSHLGDASVIHCHQTHTVASTFAALFAKLTAKRVFTTDLGGAVWDLSSYISTDRFYNGHLHISEYSRRISGHADKTWAHVVMGGVDSKKFRPGESGYNAYGPALFVGRLLPHKGVCDLVDAAPDDYSVELVGRPYHELYFAELQRRAIGKRITFFTNSDDSALLAAYQRSSCVVLPSVYSGMFGSESKVPELLGQTLIEGMACGIPAICTDVASMPEVVENGITGFVVPPNNPIALREKLLWLRDNPIKAEQMGKAARLRVLDSFSWSTVVGKCLNEYYNAQK